MFGIFKSPFKVRLYEKKQEDENLTFPYTETEVSLDVQIASDQNQPEAEGDSRLTKLTAYGSFPFSPADQMTGKPGDWLCYHGRWYECIGSAHHLHTPSKHYVSDFVLIPEVYDKDGYAG